MKINRRFFVSILGALIPGVLLGGSNGKKYGYIVGSERCSCLHKACIKNKMHHASCPVKNHHYEPYDSIVYKTKYEAERRINLLNKSRINQLVAKKVEILDSVDLGGELGVSTVVRIAK